MASENKGIGDIVKNCKILLLDIEGTTTSISFVKDELFPYVDKNVKQFLDSQWETEDVKAVVTALRKLALEDKETSVDGVVAIPEEDATKADQIEGVVNNVKWQMSFDRKSGPLKTLQGLIWKQGYDSGDLKGHVYDDVAAALEQWRSVEGQKVYIYSSGSVTAQKLLFGQSLAGDLLKYLDGHFDTAIGAKQMPESYKNIAEKIECKPEDILFLTDIVKEAEAARSAGLQVAVVTRQGNAPLPDALPYPVLRSFAELTVNNKRKTDTQQDATPAKILKKDAEDEVKLPESESVVKTAEVDEKMETENVPSGKKEEIIVEEVTESNCDKPMSEDVESVVIEPVVIENSEKMEDVVEAEMKPAKTNEDELKEATPSVAEKAPVVITEIEDVTEKQLDEVEQMIVDDLKPIVEEPSVAELENLQNAGEVLEKECDEILSKVSNVTNLDSITIKPMLNSIAEETLEPDSTDSNDIVDKILDTEIEMEMKQCTNTDIDTSSTTKTSDEEKSGKANTEAVTEKTTETSPEVNNVPETKIENETKVENESKVTKEESSTTETSQEIEKQAEKKKEVVEENTTEEVKQVTEEKSNGIETVAEHDKKEEPTVNGKVTNGDEETTTNGDIASDDKTNGDKANGDKANGDEAKGDDVNSRLAVTNGKVNGSNDEAVVSEQGQGDCKGFADIKVKTVVTEEPPTDPVEQPTTA